MEISAVLAAVAVKDLASAKRWYATFFGRSADAEPMGEVAEWHTPGGTLQVVTDPRRAGGSMATFLVPDAQATVTALAERGGPAATVDDSSDKVRYVTVEDPDGNALTIVELRPGASL